MECGELDIFLRRNETYKESEFEKPAPEVKPVGVPGAYSPSQMHPKYKPSLSPSPSPLKNKTKGRVSSTGQNLSEYGIHDLDVTDDDLAALVQELGLGGDDAKDLVKGLGQSSGSAKPKEKEASIDLNTKGGEGKVVTEAVESPGPAKSSEAEPAADESTKSD